MISTVPMSGATGTPAAGRPACAHPGRWPRPKATGDYHQDVIEPAPAPNDGFSAAERLARALGRPAPASLGEEALRLFEAEQDRADDEALHLAGEYASESEVVGEGLRPSFARDRAVGHWLRTDVVAAYDALQGDPSRTVGATDLRARLAALHAERVATERGRLRE
jgi:Arc/MetJ-type ribon-helix-helix transcriptional regulator